MKKERVPIYKNFYERILRLTEIHLNKEDCWNWHGNTARGYSVTAINKNGWSKKIIVHRWMYEKFFGKIPKDKVLDHLCRNRRCVNPFHLEAVTSRENVLRGTGPSAVNYKKTHCVHGHEFTPENTILREQASNPKYYGRRCRVCVNNQATIYRNRRKESSSSITISRRS